MFKSILPRTVSVLFILAWSMYSGHASGYREALHTPDSLPVPDSALQYLSSPEFNRKLDQAVVWQLRADSLNRLSVEMRKEAAGMDDPVSRGQFQKKIIKVEDSVLVLRSVANEQFLILREGLPGHLISRTAEESPHPFLVKDTVRNGITVYHYVLNDELMARLGEIRKPVDSGAPDPLAEVSGTIERDFTIPPGVFYRIQLVVYKNDFPADHFGGLSALTTEYIPDKELIRYFTGKFTHYDDAKAALVKVKAMGYPDAFIVGYYDGVKASFSKLKALEN